MRGESSLPGRRVQRCLAVNHCLKLHTKQWDGKQSSHGSLFAFYGLGVLQLSLTWDSICNWVNVTSLLMPGSHSLAPAKLFFSESPISCEYSAVYLWFVGVGDRHVRGQA